ncbi:MAG: DedA family protein [Acidimicrobiales bacterium]
MQSFIQHYGYFALVVLSIATAACIPLPSEVIFVLAGALCTTAVTGHAQFSLWLVIVVGTVGTLVGSIIAYEVSRSLGREIVDRWGKWILLSHRDLDNSQRWFEKYGSATVLVGRVMPVVRSFVSVPAGIAEMNRARFIVLTTIGSAIWVVLLGALGEAAGANWTRVSHDFHDSQTPIIVLIVLLVVAAFWHRLRSVRRDRANESR